VFLQQDQTAIVLSKQLLYSGNGKVTIDTLTGFITLTSGFCHFTDSKRGAYWEYFSRHSTTVQKP